VTAPTLGSYWVEEGALLAGAYPGSTGESDARRTVEALCAAGVRAFVDLTEDGELLPYADFLAAGARPHQMPIVDFDCPSREAMKVILDRIDGARQAGRIVYVHCWGGVGRTGTVVGCWLVRHGLSGEDALELIRRQRAETPAGRRESPETAAQRAMVIGWRRGE
jgi:protein-tyrosine phosphatase